MTAVSPHLEALTDAIARGRLALAEVAAIPPRELDAMFELAAQCLDAGRDREAANILGGLVALFPFSARFWRAFAVALHRVLDFQRARSAYEAALALEPDHDAMRCYRAEVLIYLGSTAAARRELEALLTTSERGLQARARELLQRLPDLAAFGDPAETPDEPETGEPGADLPRFTIGGDRELPLLETQFIDGEETQELMRPEITSTARIFAPILDEPTAPFDAPGELTRQTVTETAVIRHREPAAPRAEPANSARTATALIGARARARAQLLQHRKPPSPTSEATLARLRPDATRTAIAMRREHEPLVGDDPTGAAVHPGLDDDEGES